MLSLLIIEEDEPFVEGFEGYLASVPGEFRVTRASAGSEAEALLERAEFDVVLAGGRATEKRSLELVRRARRWRPSLRAVVLTPPGDAPSEDPTDGGGIRLLRLPLAPAEVRRALLAAATDVPGWSGHVGGLEIFDLVQLFAFSERSQALVVICEGHRGALWFDGGRLRHASADTLTGDEAFLAMCDWKGGSFELIPRSRMTPWGENVETPVAALLLEAARRRDEADHAARYDDSNFHRANAAAQAPAAPEPGKEERMDIPRLHKSIENLVEALGPGLLATDVFGAADGQSIAGFNPQPKASALFNQLTDTMVRALRGSGFPALGRFFYLELDGGLAVIIVPLGDYRHGLLVDTKKVQLGLLLNVVLPESIAALGNALGSAHAE